MAIVQITGVDLDGPDGDNLGYYVDDEGTVRSTRLSYGEAQAIIAELKETEVGVGYEVPGRAV